VQRLDLLPLLAEVLKDDLALLRLQRNACDLLRAGDRLHGDLHPRGGAAPQHAGQERAAKAETGESGHEGAAVAGLAGWKIEHRDLVAGETLSGEM
jgi:hypothetical protein